MILEAAIGDALGACFEWGVEGEELAKNNDLHYRMIQPGLIKPGCYTDDTQMMIALTEAIVEDDPWTKESLAERFVRAFRRDERRGYTGVFFQILINTDSGKELLTKINGSSDKSGAAMRAGPVGLFPTVDEVWNKSLIQSSVTHNSPGGFLSGFMSALMVHYFAYEIGSKEEIDIWINEQLLKYIPLDIYTGDWEGGRVSTNGVCCVRAAKTAIKQNRTLSQILQQCISYGGDTDTIACIALAAASMSKTIKNDLPQRLYDGLENGKYGKDFLIDLDSRLLAKFKVDNGS
jgi:ADP-ribosyl-[dinitrogen reductase] hydrolase